MCWRLSPAPPGRWSGIQNFRGGLVRFVRDGVAEFGGLRSFTRVVLAILFALPVVIYPFRELTTRKKKKEAKDRKTLVYAQLIANNPPKTYEEMQLEALEAKYETPQDRHDA